jgi:hypothetical protein
MTLVEELTLEASIVIHQEFPFIRLEHWTFLLSEATGGRRPTRGGVGVCKMGMGSEHSTFVGTQGCFFCKHIAALFKVRVKFLVSILNYLNEVVPTTFMIKPRHLPAHSYLSCQLEI